MSLPPPNVKTASRLDAIKPSATLAVTARAAQLRAEGKDIIALGAGEPDFDTPEHIKAAARDALGKGAVAKYTEVGGTPQLRAAIAAELGTMRVTEQIDALVTRTVPAVFTPCTTVASPACGPIVPLVAPCSVGARPLLTVSV